LIPGCLPLAAISKGTPGQNTVTQGGTSPRAWLTCTEHVQRKTSSPHIFVPMCLSGRTENSAGITCLELSLSYNAAGLGEICSAGFVFFNAFPTGPPSPPPLGCIPGSHCQGHKLWTTVRPVRGRAKVRLRPSLLCPVLTPGITQNSPGMFGERFPYLSRDTGHCRH
jgi:hypothetical protein